MSRVTTRPQQLLHGLPRPRARWRARAPNRRSRRRGARPGRRCAPGPRRNASTRVRDGPILVRASARAPTSTRPPARPPTRRSRSGCPPPVETGPGRLARAGDRRPAPCELALRRGVALRAASRTRFATSTSSSRREPRSASVSIRSILRHAASESSTSVRSEAGSTPPCADADDRGERSCRAAHLVHHERPAARADSRSSRRTGRDALERPRGRLAEHRVVVPRHALDGRERARRCRRSRPRRARCDAATADPFAERRGGRARRRDRRRRARASPGARPSAANRPSGAARRAAPLDRRGSTGRRPGRCRTRTPSRRGRRGNRSGIGAGACVQYERQRVASSSPGSSSAPVGHASMQRRQEPQSSSTGCVASISTSVTRSRGRPTSHATGDQHRVLPVEPDARPNRRFAVDVVVGVHEHAVSPPRRVPSSSSRARRSA